MATGRTAPPRPHAGRQAGFSYLAALFLVLVMGLGLAGASQSWTMAGQRARERELLWVGNQYARALKSYHDQSPGLRQYPAALEDLLEDRRFPVPRRHLRRLYPDPVTRGTDWGLVKTPDGRIAGVYSLSEAPPWKRAHFPLRWEHFAKAEKYSEWKFVADNGLLGKPGAGSGTPLTGAAGFPAAPPGAGHPGPGVPLRPGAFPPAGGAPGPWPGPRE